MKVTPIKRESLDKLEAMVHYISHKCSDPSKLGAVKLNKVLWFSDCYSYLLTGKSITDARYIKLPFGPVPKDIEEVKTSLVTKGDISIESTMCFNHTQKQFKALTSPDLNKFTANEISMVDEVLADICDNHTAVSISSLSHDIIWEAAEVGEEIPLYTIFASRTGSISPSDLTWAKLEIEEMRAAS